MEQRLAHLSARRRPQCHKGPGALSSPPARPPCLGAPGHRIETVSSTMTLGCVRLRWGLGTAVWSQSPQAWACCSGRDSLAWKLGLQGQHELPLYCGEHRPSQHRAPADHPPPSSVRAPACKTRHPGNRSPQQGACVSRPTPTPRTNGAGSPVVRISDQVWFTGV